MIGLFHSEMTNRNPALTEFMTNIKASLHAVIAAGPTYEPMDQVRRLTNFSTGSLGAQLAGFLMTRGIKVTLLTGYYATYNGPYQADVRQSFTTTEDLATKMEALKETKVDAVFHAAAVSDFRVEGLYRQTSSGELESLKSGKVSTRDGAVMAKLVPTPKLLEQLRQWFPNAWITGWKYEVEGSYSELCQKVTQQLANCQTDACVLNGPALGDGFELFLRETVKPEVAADRSSLFDLLLKHGLSRDN